MPIAFWLLHSAASPLYEYAIWHPLPGNILGYLGLPAFLAGVVVSGNVHQPGAAVAYLALFVEWFGLAYLCSLMLFRRT